jgi:hypothetical protein
MLTYFIGHLVKAVQILKYQEASQVEGDVKRGLPRKLFLRIKLGQCNR